MLKLTKSTLAIAALLSTIAFNNVQAAASVGPIGTNPNKVDSYVVGYTINGRPVYSDGSIHYVPVTEYAVERLKNGISPHRNIDYSTGQVISNPSKFAWDNDKQMYVDSTNSKAVSFVVDGTTALNIAQVNNFTGVYDYTTGAKNINPNATVDDKVNPNPVTPEPEVPVEPEVPTEPEVNPPVKPDPVPTIDTDNYMGGSDTIGQGPGANDNYMGGSDTVGQVKNSKSTKSSKSTSVGITVNSSTQSSRAVSPNVSNTFKFSTTD